MVVTVLEAQVTSANVMILQETYQQAVQNLDKGIIQTFLLNNTKDPATWQIVTIWENRMVLDAMRQSGDTPRGVLIFKAAGVVPTLSVYDVVVNGMR
ncbi:MAG: hypothetical protein ACYDH1_00695 [Anaerolineaceae bacterium]|nr:MAG: hypothetical protein CVU46_07120 [Chloroflexi bacterium HGW-Chloroflexi-8]